ncbi:YciI family protein [Tahibacter harae]|uniref:YciI family protein n=1 Tax=Tahibacter harae TaxID=2963937 RepID=A0ABT1QPH9_9GAMM|nr:YciI family protein [Tahibacter harae]MCQ4164194.1 YciI family protein [Tahibacter harae]
MKFLMLVYTDDALIEALPPGEYDRMMRECLLHADELRAEGKLLDSQQLELPRTAKSIRKRGDKVSVLDGPFAETKEILGGFNLLEAADLDEALRIAEQFPWTRTGSIEVRPVRDIDLVRDCVGAQRA